jgi:hypothetical protein
LCREPGNLELELGYATPKRDAFFSASAIRAIVQRPDGFRTDRTRATLPASFSDEPHRGRADGEHNGNDGNPSQDSSFHVSSH